RCSRERCASRRGLPLPLRRLLVAAPPSGCGMRIWLMALNAAGTSGVPRYTAMLGRALDEVAPEWPELEFTLVTTPAGVERTSPRALAVRQLESRVIEHLGGAGRILMEYGLLRPNSADLVHFVDVGA